MLAHAGACVVWAEALSIRRELTSGWTSGQEESEMEQGGDGEDEQSHMLSNNQAPTMEQRRQSTHVLFQGDENDIGEDLESKSKGKKANGNGHGHENIEMKRLD